MSVVGKKSWKKRNLSSSLLFSCFGCFSCCFYFSVTFTFFLKKNYTAEIRCILILSRKHHKRTMKWTIWKLKLKQKIFLLKKQKKKDTVHDELQHAAAARRWAKISAKMAKNKNNLTLMSVHTHTHTQLEVTASHFSSLCALSKSFPHLFPSIVWLTAITLSRQLLNFFCFSRFFAPFFSRIIWLSVFSLFVVYTVVATLLLCTLICKIRYKIVICVNHFIHWIGNTYTTICSSLLWNISNLFSLRFALLCASSSKKNVLC